MRSAGRRGHDRERIPQACIGNLCQRDLYKSAIERRQSVQVGLNVSNGRWLNELEVGPSHVGNFSLHGGAIGAKVDEITEAVIRASKKQDYPIFWVKQVFSSIRNTCRYHRVLQLLIFARDAHPRRQDRGERQLARQAQYQVSKGVDQCRYVTISAICDVFLLGSLYKWDQPRIWCAWHRQRVIECLRIDRFEAEDDRVVLL